MSHIGKFQRSLDELFRQRTHWLRKSLGASNPGQPPRMTRAKVDTAIDKLQTLASNALASKLAKEEFKEHTQANRWCKVKGRGFREKRKNFQHWLETQLPDVKGYVYSFWNQDKKCVYVGRTGNGGTRPTSHFEKVWFPPVRRIKIYPTDSISQLPKLECLAQHYFQPKENTNKAATKKWTKACPLCEVHQLIEEELRRIFRLR